MGRYAHLRRARKRDAAGQAEAFRSHQLEQERERKRQRESDDGPPRKRRNREKSWVKRGEESHADRDARLQQQKEEEMQVLFNARGVDAFSNLRHSRDGGPTKSRLPSTSNVSLSTATNSTSTTMSNNDGDDLNYGNTHRALLQSLLARQSITFEEAQPLLAAIQTAATPDRRTLPGDISQEDFEDYIDTINSQISSFDFEIRKSRHQISKQWIYALVNTTSDALTQMATIHSADEIAFVKRVLDAMFETYNTPRAEVMAVTSMQALKLAKPPLENGRRESGTQAQSQNLGLTMAQAEKVLEDMVSEGWFELSGRGFYSLYPRALMELRGWLVDTYNEPADDEEEDEDEERHDKIKFCQACKEIVTIGQRCPKMSCEVRLHNHCKSNMWRQQGGQERCPQCKTAWEEAPPVGEKAARAGRSSNASGVNGASRRSRGMAMDGADDDDESDAVGGAG